MPSFAVILPQLTFANTNKSPEKEARNIASSQPHRPKNREINAESLASPLPIFPLEINQNNQMKMKPIIPSNRFQNEKSLTINSFTIITAAIPKPIKISGILFSFTS